MKSHIQRIVTYTVGILVSALSPTLVLAQLDFAPTSVIMSSDARSATLLVRNTGNDDREMEMTAFFGYAVTDSLGVLSTKKDDSTREARYSLLPYVRFFPKKFNLKSGAEQLVKFLVTPRADLKPGAYWSRLAVKSRPIAKPLEQQVSDSIALNFQLILERVTAIVYFNLPFEIGLELNTVRAVRERDSVLHVIVPMTAIGDSPFWGRATIKVRDESGTLIDERFEMLAVYFNMLRRYDFDPEKFARGKKYIAEISITSERDELPASIREKFAAFEKRFEFVAP